MNCNLVSVIITTFRASERLNDAIESVLSQTYPCFEIIVVDDNNPGTEERAFTESLMMKYKDDNRIKYIKHEKNRNGAAARNTGIKAANGAYIAFLDDDDVYFPERLARCVEVLDNNKEYVAVYTATVYIDREAVFVREARKKGLIWKELLLNEGLLGTGSNIFVRHITVDEVNGFDERFIRYQDVEFMIRISTNNKVYALNKILVQKNIEETNIPRYSDYLDNKKLIFCVFENLIERLNDDERREFYKGHYQALLKAAYKGGKAKEISMACKDYKEYGKLSFKQLLIAYYPKLYSAYRMLLNQ